MIEEPTFPDDDAPPPRSRAVPIVAAILVAALVLGGAASLFGGRGGGPNPPGARDLGKVNAAARAAGCSEVSVIAERGRDHIPAGARGTYSTDPPTSGSHYSVGAPGGPAYTGPHDEPIAAEAQVHNLEHGHIGIQWQPTVARRVREALAAYARSNERWVFAAPRPTMAPKIALTAWNHLVVCMDVRDDPRSYTELAAAFDEALGDNSPYESIPGARRP